jgi:hypothetical protein
MATCVNNIDFVTVDGVLGIQRHAARMVNDVQTRVVPGSTLDDDTSDFIIPGFDTIDYEYGTVITADNGSGRFLVSETGVYHVCGGYGDNPFQANTGALLYLTIFVGGTSVARTSAVHVGEAPPGGDPLEAGDKTWMNVCTDVEILAGSTVRLMYSVVYCDPPPPPDPPICLRSDHFLQPDNRNFFSIHRISGANA